MYDFLCNRTDNRSRAKRWEKIRNAQEETGNQKRTLASVPESPNLWLHTCRQVKSTLYECYEWVLLWPDFPDFPYSPSPLIPVSADNVLCFEAPPLRWASNRIHWTTAWPSLYSTTSIAIAPLPFSSLFFSTILCFSAHSAREITSCIYTFTYTYIYIYMHKCMYIYECRAAWRL